MPCIGHDAQGCCTPSTSVGASSRNLSPVHSHLLCNTNYLSGFLSMGLSLTPASTGAGHAGWLVVLPGPYWEAAIVSVMVSAQVCGRNPLNNSPGGIVEVAAGGGITRARQKLGAPVPCCCGLCPAPSSCAVQCSWSGGG